MILGKVVGSVVSTIKDSNFKGEKLMVIQPIDLDGHKTGSTFIALDRVDAGKGDRVIINKEGGGTAIMYGTLMPVQAVIVGVIDRLEIEYDGS
jgi:ethanolamine utilization protein EutN